MSKAKKIALTGRMLLSFEGTLRSMVSSPSTVTALGCLGSVFEVLAALFLVAHHRDNIVNEDGGIGAILERRVTGHDGSRGDVHNGMDGDADIEYKRECGNEYA